MITRSEGFHWIERAGGVCVVSGRTAPRPIDCVPANTSGLRGHRKTAIPPRGQPNRDRPPITAPTSVIDSDLTKARRRPVFPSARESSEAESLSAASTCMRGRRKDRVLPRVASTANAAEIMVTNDPSQSPALSPSPAGRRAERNRCSAPMAGSRKDPDFGNRRALEMFARQVGIPVDWPQHGGECSSFSIVISRIGSPADIRRKPLCARSLRSLPIASRQVLAPRKASSRSPLRRASFDRQASTPATRAMTTCGDSR